MIIFGIMAIVSGGVLGLAIHCRSSYFRSLRRDISIWRQIDQNYNTNYNEKDRYIGELRLTDDEMAILDTIRKSVREGQISPSELDSAIKDLSTIIEARMVNGKLG